MMRHRRWSFLVVIIMVIPFGNTPPPTYADSQMLPHIVQPGDTINDLALFYGVPPAELPAYNEDIDFSIPVGMGQFLYVPVVFNPASDPLLLDLPSDPFVYTVTRGDTLFRIATRFNVTARDIAIANNLRNPDRIYTGQELLIPVGEDFSDVVDVPWESSDPPPPTLTSSKQIVISLSQQQTFAYENGTLVRQFVISSGLPGTPTVLGDFSIYLKYEAQTMSGPGYYLPNVPWVMYFYRGYALHGTYWHNNFGQPMSHGCVNMRTPEAEWLYQWAPIGTAVRVVN